MTDIVERLRHDAAEARKNYPEVFCVSEDLADEAADEIERLSMDRDVWRNESIKKQAACEQMGARITALEAERDRLREALQDMLADREAWQIGRDTRDRARAALKEISHD